MKTPDTEEYLVYDPIYMKFKKRWNESVVIDVRAHFLYSPMERFGEEGVPTTFKREWPRILHRGMTSQNHKDSMTPEWHCASTI